MLKIDSSLLAGRIRVAEEAIEARKLRLVRGSDSQREFRDLNDALQNLRVLKRELTIPSPAAVDENHSHPELEGAYVAFVSSDRRYVAVTDGVCQLLGYSRQELLTKKIDDLTAPELKPAVPDTFQQYVQQGHLHGEFTLVGKDGRHVPILYEALVFPDGCMTARWRLLEK